MAGVNVVFFVFTMGLRVSVGQGTDPCDSHTLLIEEWRNPGSNAVINHCDNLPVGWYAFEINKNPAVIPHLCLQDNTCGTRVPLHVELNGQASLVVGENVTAFLCGSFDVLGSIDCCVQRQPITIKRCRQDLFVYWLKPQTICPVAVCAKEYGTSVSPQFTAKRGDTPRSRLSATETPFPDTCNEGQPLCPDGRCPPCLVTPTPSGDTAATTGIVRTLSQDLSPAPPVIPRFSPIAPPSSSGNNSSSISPIPVPSTMLQTHPNGSDSVSPPSSSFSNSSDVFSSSSPAPPFWEQVSDRENATDLAAPVGISKNMTLGWQPENVTSGYSDKLNSANVATPEVKRSSEIGPGTTRRAVTASPSSYDAEDWTTTTKVTTEGPVGTGASGFATPSQEHVADLSGRMRGNGDRFTSGVTGDGGMMTASVPPSTPESLSSDAVRFVLIGTYEESEFRDALLVFVNNVSRILTYGSVDGEEESEGDGGVHLQNLTIRAQTSLPTNITVVDVLVADPTTNGTIPAQRFVTIIKNEKFAELLLSRAGQRLVKVCPSVDRCDLGVIPDESPRSQSQSLFDRNRGVFIAVIVVAALCLLVLLIGLLILRCRRRGVWVLAPDHEEKGGDPLTIENPMTDHQILQGEEQGQGQGRGREADTTPALNGDHHHYHRHHASPTTATASSISSGPDNLHADIPAADEDNGWVVPLDQAPPHSTPHGLAERTEDTQF